MKQKKNGIELPKTYTGYSQHSYDTQNLSTAKLSAAQILKFRDEVWMKYHTNEKYLKLINEKFGSKAVENIKETTKIKLKRKLLGD